MFCIKSMTQPAISLPEARERIMPMTLLHTPQRTPLRVLPGLIAIPVAAVLAAVPAQARFTQRRPMASRTRHVQRVLDHLSNKVG
jgi:hypothetical protein